MSWYGRSKLEGERVALASGLPVVILRPPVVFGPEDRDVLGYFRLARRGLLPVPGPGSRRYSLVYAPDLADGLVRAAQTPCAAGAVFHLTGPDLDWADFGRRIAAALGRPARVLALPEGLVRACGLGADLWARLRGRPGIFSSQKVREMLAPGWVASPDKARRGAGLDRPHGPGPGHPGNRDVVPGPWLALSAPSPWTPPWGPGGPWTGGWPATPSSPWAWRRPAPCGGCPGARPRRCCPYRSWPWPWAWPGPPGPPPAGCSWCCGCSMPRCCTGPSTTRSRPSGRCSGARPWTGPWLALEARLWGFQPALAFRPALPYRWLSELFCFAYFAYYFFIPVLGLTVLIRRGYGAAERIILAATVLFYACYTFFWLAPTVGPQDRFPPGRGPELAQGYVFNHLLYVLTSGGEIRGAAFPSSHLAVALLLTLHARRAAPALFPAMAVITALLVPAVVYLRAHYVLDVPAGLLAGWAAYLASRPARPANPTAAV